MNIRELLIEDFGIDLPISGGLGNSIDDPVIIERTGNNDYAGIEHTFLKYIGLGRGIEWKLIQQELLEDNGRTLDKIKIETKQLTSTEVITQVENYYFDITDCYGEK